MRKAGRFVCLLALWGTPAAAQSASLSTYPTEYQTKAVFLYNFTKFVEWPPAAAGSREPLVIAVFGQDPFVGALRIAVLGKVVGDRPLVVRRVTRLEELMPCHMLFVSAQERKVVPEIVKAVDSASVLTISEINDFLDMGGMVRFAMDGQRARLGVNLEAARRSRLTISSKLLSLAAVKN